MVAPGDWTQLVMQLADPSQPDWVALEHGDRQMSIKELSRAMLTGAGALADAGAGVLAVCTEDPILHTVAVLAAVAAGRTAMLVDHHHPDELLAEVVQRTGAEAIVGRPLAGVTAIDADTLTAGAPLQPGLHPGEQIGSIFLTSGSTGAPKLVMRTRSADLHAAMCLRLANFPIEPGDRHWLCVPYAAAPFLTLVMGALLARASVVFADFDRTSVDAFLHERRVSSAYLVPTMLRLAREHGGLDGPGWRGMRALMTGGEKLDRPTAEVLLERFDGRVYCAYGMTEAPRLTEATFEEIAARPGTVGRPIPFRRVRIAPVGEDGATAVGEEGEVLVSGPEMFHGYLGGKPVGDWYRTGDLGHVDEDGYLYITGRASSVVKVAGNRVSTEEVESVLRSHGEVAQVAVIALEDPMWTNRLEAFVVAAGPGAPEGEQLRDWLGERLASYKVPRVVRIVAELPVDSSGKASLQLLRALALEARS